MRNQTATGEKEGTVTAETSFDSMGLFLEMTGLGFSAMVVSLVTHVVLSVVKRMLWIVRLRHSSRLKDL